MTRDKTRIYSIPHDTPGIVTERESMASLIHDTSPTLRHSLQQSHNKGLYCGFGDAILSRLVTIIQVPGASCGILYILVLSLVIFMQSYIATLSNLQNFSFTCLLSFFYYF